MNINKKQLLEELKSEGFSELIIKAFKKVKRENFVPEEYKEYAYRNEPLPIGKGATISQPYTIAFMLNLLELDKLIDKSNNQLVIDNNKRLINKINKLDKLNKHDISSLPKNQKYNINNKLITDKNKGVDKIKILEIGSGSGYVLALINETLKNLKIKDTKKLSVFGAQKIKDFSSYNIFGIEIIDELVIKSKKILKKEKNIIVKKADGSKGLKSKAPFDRILVSASFREIPDNLLPQLKNNGILVTPVKNSIFKFKKINGKIEKKEFPGFVFVPVVEK